MEFTIEDLNNEEDTDFGSTLRKGYLYKRGHGKYRRNHYLKSQITRMIISYYV